jgi:hypothetical protein
LFKEPNFYLKVRKAFIESIFQYIFVPNFFSLLFLPMLDFIVTMKLCGRMECSGNDVTHPALSVSALYILYAEVKPTASSSPPP